MHTTASNDSSVLTLSDGWVDMISLVNISKLRLVSLNFVSCTDSLTYADVDIVSKNRKFFYRVIVENYVKLLNAFKTH